MNDLSSRKLAKLSREFRASLANNSAVFGKHAFRKHTAEKEGRSILNASLWDVMSTGLSGYSEPVVEERADQLRTAFYSLMDDDKFKKAITYGPNTPTEVRHRFKAAKEMFLEVFGANAT